MIESVKKLRSRINAADSPVLYKWWFKYDKRIWDKFVSNGIDTARLEVRNIDGEDYYALYVGIGASCISRFRWHIIPSVHHTPSAVNSGVISTLRKTLCALLDLKLLGAEQFVNQYMDDHCFLEWKIFHNGISKPGLEDIESDRINAGYYPLNIQSNGAVPKEWLRYLKEMRSRFCSN